MPYDLVGRTETIEQILLLILSFWKNVIRLSQWSQACDTDYAQTGLPPKVRGSNSGDPGPENQFCI